MSSRLFAYKRGQVGAPFLATTMLATIARRATRRQQSAAFDMALDRALLDPDFAAQLLRENNPANREALRRSAKGWMGEHVSEIVNLAGPHDAIMRRAR